jgi:hypothetical protein
MLWQAANDYHSYYHSGLRRYRVTMALRAHGKARRDDRKVRAELILARLETRAKDAAKWFECCSAPMPFDLVAASFGWEPALMAERMMAWEVGDRLRGRYGS